jgi:prophage regulatory protein
MFLRHAAFSSSPAISDQALVLRMPSVVARTGLGRSTIYRLMAAHEFPQAVRLTSRAVGWRAADLDRWCESRSTSLDACVGDTR